MTIRETASSASRQTQGVYTRAEYDILADRIRDALGDEQRDETTRVTVYGDDACWWGGLTFTDYDWSSETRTFTLMGSDGFIVQRMTITDELLEGEPSDGGFKQVLGMLTTQALYTGPSDWERDIEEEFRRSYTSDFVPTNRFRDDERNIILCKHESYETFLLAYGFEGFTDLDVLDAGNRMGVIRERRNLTIDGLAEEPALLEASARCLYRSLPVQVRMLSWLIERGDGWDDGDPLDNPWWAEFKMWWRCCDRLRSEGDWDASLPEDLCVTDLLCAFLRHMTKGMDWEVGACGGPEPPVTVALPYRPIWTD